MEWEFWHQCWGGQGPLLPGVLVAWMSRMSIRCWTREEGSSFTKYVLGLTSFSSFSFKLYDNLSGISYFFLWNESWVPGKLSNLSGSSYLGNGWVELWDCLTQSTRSFCYTRLPMLCYMMVASSSHRRPTADYSEHIGISCYSFCEDHAPSIWKASWVGERFSFLDRHQFVLI